MSTAIVVVVVVLAITVVGGPTNIPDREQLRRDEDDIAIYGAVARPPSKDEGHCEREGITDAGPESRRCQRPPVTTDLHWTAALWSSTPRPTITTGS